MAECRYFPECQRCNEVGDSWIPCTGGSDGIRCDNYEPMPDVDALLALASRIEHRAKLDIEKRGPYYGANEWLATAAHIREACGEVPDAGAQG